MRHPPRESYSKLHQPELMITGLTLRGGDGLRLIKDLREFHPTPWTLTVWRSADTAPAVLPMNLQPATGPRMGV